MTSEEGWPTIAMFLEWLQSTQTDIDSKMGQL